MKKEQKKLITEIMNDDAKDDLYKQTAVEFIVEQMKNGKWEYTSYEERKRIIEQAKQMEAEQSKIPELSDEDIIKGLCGKYYDPNNDVHYNLVEGAKWHREQLKNKQ